MDCYQKLLLLGMISIQAGCCFTRPSCNPETGNLNWGPEISYGATSYWGEDTKDSDLKHVGSLGLGLFGEWRFCDDFPAMGLNSGLFYKQFGARNEYDGEKSKDRLHYLTIPLTYTYNVYNGLRLEAGPDFSVLLAAKEKYEYMGQKETQNAKEYYHNAQVGFNLSVSYTDENSGFGAFVRYNGGVTKLSSNKYDYKAYNGGISVGGRYSFNSLFNKD